MKAADTPGSSETQVKDSRLIPRCRKCGLPTSWEITRLDVDGVCNYCHYYESIKNYLVNYPHWETIFKGHLDTYRGCFEYDAVVGFSGGKDSSYILYTLKKHYGCKVLAVTVDFGFMPSGPAIDNIQRVINSLEIDHLRVKVPDEEVKNGFTQAIQSGHTPCEFCSSITWLIPRQIAVNKNIPFFIMGSDRGQLLRSLSPETAPVSGAGYLKAILSPYSEGKTHQFDSPKRADQMRSWLRKLGLSKKYTEELFPTPQHLPGTTAYPMGLQFFMFHPYREQEIKEALVKDAGWRLPDRDHLHAHHDCILHDTAMYFFREATGNTLTAGEIAVDAREGSITRQDVVDVLTAEQHTLNQLNNPYAILQEQFGIPERAVHRSARKFHNKVALFRRLRKLQLKVTQPKLDVFPTNELSPSRRDDIR